MNRVGTTWCDQVERSGHTHRLDDLHRFADLGIQALRYPVLWERTAPNGVAEADWSWSDQRLNVLQELGIRPIVGLVHHGSGPATTDLLDPQWPEQLADYASCVAQRYPWLTDYTPVNEPLTTARFSALYGHWYPHRTDDRAFARALVNQVKGVIRSMERIREVNPDARLIQTEDLAFVSASPELEYQARFENERRWTTIDLLMGKLRPGMLMYRWLRDAGISMEELDWFRSHAMPPDVIGWNYYVLSERHLVLDEEAQSGNHLHHYRDCDAARSCGLRGLEQLLIDAYTHYHTPMAVTESHLAGTRDEQLRWLVECWDAAHAAQVSGVEMSGFTVWSLLGAFDWDTLCTDDRGRYEPGAFDTRGPTPRPTALAGAVRSLARGVRPDHPVLDAPGWWHQWPRH